MKVLIFGATGLIGQGVLRECLRDPQVERVTAVGRAATGQQHPKLREIVQRDLFDLSPLAEQLGDHDACFYCLGVSSAGMSEADYRRVTHDLTLAIAGPLARRNPNMSFVFLSGSGADGSEKSRMMWARVKGRTENEVRKLFRTSFVVRPGYVQPMHGITSKTRLYRVLYRVVAPLYPLLRRVFPNQVTTTEQIGRAMIALARDGAAIPLLENRDLNALGQRELAASAA
jgi:uncharacterized protein YbjT (DUF2867 family)